MKQRIISAIVVLAIFIPLLLLGGALFNLFIIIVAALGLKEMMEIRETKYPQPMLMKLVAFASLIWIVLNNASNDSLIYSLDYRVISIILFAFLIPIIIYNDSRVYNINDAIFLIGNVIFLGVAFNLALLIREYNILYFVYIFLITSITDTYAFMAGMLVGKHKLIEKISPKKTWEGTIVGTIFGVLISATFYYIAINDGIDIWYLILSTTALSILAQLGDLLFSSIKRLYNKKDFSNIMPGHGGVLDRLDSIIFVILGFVLFMSIL